MLEHLHLGWPARRPAEVSLGRHGCRTGVTRPGMGCAESFPNDALAVPPSRSPILMTFPGAVLLQLGDDGIAPTRLQDTSHYQITAGILRNPEQYWKHLRGPPPEEEPR